MLPYNKIDFPLYKQSKQLELDHSLLSLDQHDFVPLLKSVRKNLELLHLSLANHLDAILLLYMVLNHLAEPADLGCADG